MNTQPYYITAEQYQTLQSYIDSSDRTGFYVALHNMTGSQAALDMAEISSSSDLLGGTAWSVNQAYQGAVPGYPSTVESFSIAVAHGNLDQITAVEGGLYRVPSDFETYAGAKQTWNDIGAQYGNEHLGDQYFPGNPLLYEHYLLS
jgi:hypothetical protein